MFPVNQLASGPYPHTQCGPACTRSILHDFGKDHSLAAIDAFDAAHGDSVSDGSSVEVMQAKLKAEGIPSSLHRGNTAQLTAVIKAGASKGLNRWVILIRCNSMGDPQAVLKYNHFVVTDGVSVMNPIGAKISSGAYLGRCLKNLAANSAGQGVILQVDKPVKQPSKIQLIVKKIVAKIVKPAAKPVLKKPIVRIEHYKVVPGDTMSGIAKKKGLTLAQMIHSNPQVKDINKIFPGQVLSLPMQVLK